MNDVINYQDAFHSQIDRINALEWENEQLGAEVVYRENQAGAGILTLALGVLIGFIEGVLLTVWWL